MIRSARLLDPEASGATLPRVLTALGLVVVLALLAAALGPDAAWGLAAPSDEPPAAGNGPAAPPMTGPG